MQARVGCSALIRLGSWYSPVAVRGASAGRLRPPGLWIAIPMPTAFADKISSSLVKWAITKTPLAFASYPLRPLTQSLPLGEGGKGGLFFPARTQKRTEIGNIHFFTPPSPL